MFRIDRIQRGNGYNLQALLIILAVLALIGLPVHTVRAQDCIFPASVGTEGELNQSIACYNAQSAAGEYVIRLTAPINLTATTTTINNATSGVSLRIDGANQTVRGASNVRPFTIASQTNVIIENIVIRGGRLSSTDTGGGAILNSGLLTVTHSLITESSGYQAGSIFNKGVLTLSHSTVSDNGAFVGGGINNEGVLAVYNTIISENRGTTAGGIANSGTLTVVDSIIRDNDGDSGGGGIFNAGAAVVKNSTLSGNSAVKGGGIRNSSTLTILNSTLSDNRAAFYSGGGIWNGSGAGLTVTNSTFHANSASSGGSGIDNEGGILTLANTIIANRGSNRDCVRLLQEIK